MFSSSLSVILLGIISWSYSLAMDQTGCLTSNEGSFQLVNGASNLNGMVKVCYSASTGERQDPSWLPVCSESTDTMNDLLARVICGYLGFNETGSSISVNDTTSSAEALQCHLDSERMTLTCMSVISCSQFVVVNCIPAQCNDGDIRLRDGVDQLEGRVEICLNRQWGTVQQTGWDEQEASVVCGQLGFSREGARSLQPNDVDDGTGPIFWSNLMCDRTEERLIDCSRNQSGLSFSHDKDVGVMCEQKSVVTTTSAVTLNTNMRNASTSDTTADSEASATVTASMETRMQDEQFPTTLTVIVIVIGIVLTTTIVVASTVITLIFCTLLLTNRKRKHCITEHSTVVSLDTSRLQIDNPTYGERGNEGNVTERLCQLYESVN